jgi:hypothetical protein
MKYIKWIITRKLENIILTRLDDNCYIIEEKYFSSNPTNKIFIQVYIMSLFTNITDQSECLIKINRITNNKGYINQIYFKRNSINATVVFQQLDQNLNFTVGVDTSLKENIEKANQTINGLSSYFESYKSIIINSEDLIYSNLIDCEKILTRFFSLLQLKISTEIIQYDSHQFIEDSTWWDQSEVAEHILNMSIPSRSLELSYSNDFYHLNGTRSFIQYLSDSRRCFNEGIFTQMPSEIIPNRTSTDEPNRCLSKPVDCAFSDLYSFNDREELYQQSNTKPIKCGLAIPTIFDILRNRYGRNHTCETIIFTLITNCYDPLPIVRGTMLPSFCFIALLDARTINGYKTFYTTSPYNNWDIIDLGNNTAPFSFAAKSVETLKTLGHRVFPLAKWIVWIDGKAHIVDLNKVLIEARTPVMGAHHHDEKRTSASEMKPTIIRVIDKEKKFSRVFNLTVMEMTIQEKEYKHDGFYDRSDALGLKLYDIGIFIYRNHHPCIYRYLCGWHNEINYFSYRGQLSVYYSAVRLNLTDYLHYIPREYYFVFVHKSVC